MGDNNNWIIISIVDTSSGNKLSTSDIDSTVFQSGIQSRTLAMVSVIEKGNYAAISTTDCNAISGYYVCELKSNAYTLADAYSNGSEKIPAGEVVCDITWLNPVPHCRTMFSHGMKDEKYLNSIVRVQYVVDEKISFTKLTSDRLLSKSMKSNLSLLMEKNTIVINENCHDQIVETMHSLNHLDYDEFIYSSEDVIDSDDESLFNI